MVPVRIGFLGAGLIATFHSKMLRRAAGVERAGVFDPDRPRAEAFAAASGHHVCASEDEVLDGCDAVYVCAWTAEHPRLVGMAAARQLPVFCEKPLAKDLDGARAMAALYADPTRVNQVGLVLRRSPAYVWAYELIRDPAAGRVMSVMFRDDQFIPTQGMYGSTWRGDRDLAGSGTLLEHSIHDVDMLRYLVGDIEAVTARLANFHGLPGVEDSVVATVAFRTGALGTLNSVWHDNLARPSLRRVEVFCERRFVAIEGDDWFGPVRWTDSTGDAGVMEGDELARRAHAVAGDSNPDAAFVHSVRTGEAAWPDFATAVRAHEAVDAMYRSAVAGGAPMEVG